MSRGSSSDSWPNRSSVSHGSWSASVCTRKTGRSNRACGSFRDEAFMEEGSARREAERGTFDPMYLVYSVGKLMLMKLRNDYKQQQGKSFSLKTFHDTLLGQWHRAVVAASRADAARRYRRYCWTSHAALRVRVRARAGITSRRFSKFSDPPLETCAKCGGAVHKMQSAPAFQFKGTGWYVTDYAKSGQAGRLDEQRRHEGKGRLQEGSSKSDSSTSGSSTTSTPSSSTPARPGTIDEIERVSGSVRLTV